VIPIHKAIIEKHKHELSEEQHKIIETLTKKPVSTTQEIAKGTEIEIREMLPHLLDLASKNIVNYKKDIFYLNSQI